MELKGSKTEKNLMEAFAGESQETNIHILLHKQKRMVLFKFQKYLKKLQTTKKNTQNCGSNI